MRSMISDAEPYSARLWWSDRHVTEVMTKLNIDASVTGRTYSSEETVRLLGSPWHDRVGDLFLLVRMVNKWKRA